jgi:B-box zinc finger
MPLPRFGLDTAGETGCPSCGSGNMVRAFPAMFAERAAAPPEMALAGEAACFDHPGKRAVAACQQCGRFVCQLCSVEMGGVVYCPQCVAAGAGQARAANADAPRILYDSIALTLPVAALLLMWPVTIAAAPAALVLSIAKWKQPLSLVRQSRWRFVVAILISLAELLGWIGLVAAMVIGLRARL